MACMPSGFTEYVPRVRVDDAKPGQLPVQRVARGAGLVAHLEIPAAAQLLDELAYGLRAVGELAEAADLSAPFCDSRRDGFSVNIQTRCESVVPS
jgi:hypothetical protein